MAIVLRPRVLVWCAFAGRLRRDLFCLGRAIRVHRSVRRIQRDKVGTRMVRRRTNCVALADRWRSWGSRRGAQGSFRYPGLRREKERNGDSLDTNFGP